MATIAVCAKLCGRRGQGSSWPDSLTRLAQQALLSCHAITDTAGHWIAREHVHAWCHRPALVQHKLSFRRELPLLRVGASTIEGLKYKELIRLIGDAIDDAPRITEPGPPSYPAPAGQFDAIPEYLDVFGWSLPGILPGVGGDTVLQFLGVVGGTTLDAARGREYSEVVIPAKQQ